VDNPQEAGALGCAMAVAVALGIFEDYKEIKKVVKVRNAFMPDTARANEYDRLYANYRRLYPALSKAGHDLNK
jgi:sugar (pentulose or hexulose) kinase